MMRAMVLERASRALIEQKLPVPEPGPTELLVRVRCTGARVEGFAEGQRVGVPWLGWACGDCRTCRTGRENLCERAEFTGYQRNGGYAEYAVVSPQFALPLPGSYPDLQAAPLLCAGLIGYRALCMAG